MNKNIIFSLHPIFELETACPGMCADILVI